MRHWRGILASGAVHAAAVGFVSAGVLPASEPPIEDVPSIAVELMLEIESSPVMPSEPLMVAETERDETMETASVPEPQVEDTPRAELAAKPVVPPDETAPLPVERDLPPVVQDTPAALPEILATNLPAAPQVSKPAAGTIAPAKVKQKKPVAPAKALKPRAEIGKSGKVKKQAKQKAALAAGKGSVGKFRSTDGTASDASFKSKVLARLRNAKRYPDAARKKGLEGVAILSFTINTSGRVTSARIVKGSGHAALDQATLAMARNAQPFPAIPSGLGKGQMTFRVPVQFDID